MKDNGRYDVFRPDFEKFRPEPKPYDQYISELKPLFRVVDRERERRKRNAMRIAACILSVVIIGIAVASIPTARAFVLRTLYSIRQVIDGWFDDDIKEMPVLEHKDIVFHKKVPVMKDIAWSYYTWNGKTIRAVLEPASPTDDGSSTENHRLGTVYIPALDATGIYYIDGDGIKACVPYGDLEITITGEGITDEAAFLEIVATLRIVNTKEEAP